MLLVNTRFFLDIFLKSTFGHSKLSVIVLNLNWWNESFAYLRPEKCQYRNRTAIKIFVEAAFCCLNFLCCLVLLWEIMHMKINQNYRNIFTQTLNYSVRTKAKIVVAFIVWTMVCKVRKIYHQISVNTSNSSNLSALLSCFFSNRLFFF